MAAPFFLSYAHNDALDEHLEDFHKEVSKRVRFLTGAKEDGFKDDEKMRAGELWGPRLVTELNASPVLIALYSPSYFQSHICARELQVFLERRRRYMRENVGRKPANIIPVLWQPSEIPNSLPDFHYERPRSEDLKEKEGVWYVRDDRRLKEFAGIVHSVAKRVKESMALPLPSLSYEPVLTGVTSAFEPPPLPPTEFDAAGAASGPQCATFVYANAPAWKSWPFSPGQDPLLHIAAAVAKGKDLDTQQLTFDPGQPGLVKRLNSARTANNLMVFLVDGGSLANPTIVARLREYDGEKYDVFSTLIVWPTGATTAKAQDLVNQVFPNLSGRQPPAFWSDIQAPARFAQAVGESLDRLSNEVLKAPLPGSPAPVATPYGSPPVLTNQVRT